MTLIHMESEAVESTLRHIQRALYDMELYNRQLQRYRGILSSAWQGGTAPTEFIQDLDRNLQKLEASYFGLETLEQRLSFELKEWTEAGAHLGGAAGPAATLTAGNTEMSPAPVYPIEEIRGQVCGVAADQERCNSIWSNPPTNAEQLAYMVMSLPASLPIVILKIGNGEYLVLMRGTTSGTEEGSNWGSAGEAMFANSSYQNSVVQALNNANLPKNAQLHFAGHSQGGMIAQNLAVDPRVLGSFDVKTVTMFGSPDTMARANSDVRYVSFEAPGDIVPKLDDVVRGSLYSKGLFSVGDRFHDVTAQAERHVITNTLDAWNLDPDVSHSVYDNPDVLRDYKLPFTAEKWESVSISESKVSTLGPRIYKGLNDSAGFIGKRLQDLRVF